MSRLENSNAQRTIQNYRSFFINKSATTILIRGAAAAALYSLDSPNRVAEEHLIQVQMKQLPDKQMRIRERHPTNQPNEIVFLRAVLSSALSNGSCSTPLHNDDARFTLFANLMLLYTWQRNDSRALVVLPHLTQSSPESAKPVSE